jgi:hypothetical protein
MSVMFESDRVADMFTDRYIRIKGGHYVDTANDTDASIRFELWVRHGKDYFLINTEGWSCTKCNNRPCNKVTLSDEQKRNTIALLALLNI